jgi:hypothetical protein
MQQEEPGPERKALAPDEKLAGAGLSQEGTALGDNPAAKPQSSSRMVELMHEAAGGMKRIPPKLAALALALILLAYGAWRVFYVPDTAILNLKGQHSFRTAELSIWVDSRLAQKTQLVGSTKKRFGFVQQPVQGSFSHSLRVPAGEHTIRISIGAPSEGYSQSEELQADFQPRTQRTIIVTPERRSGRLSLAWRDAQSFTAETTTRSSGTGGIISSLLITVAGSILSGVVGFFVRERLAMLRAKKSQ